MLKTIKGDTVHPLPTSMSEAFSVPVYTLIKLCCTKALEWISLLRDLQDKVRMLRALTLCFLSIHIFCLTLLTLQGACVNEWHTLREEKWWALLCGFAVSHNDWRQPPKGEPCQGLYWPANAKRHPTSLGGERPEMGKACGLKVTRSKYGARWNSSSRNVSQARGHCLAWLLKGPAT